MLAEVLFFVVLHGGLFLLICITWNGSGLLLLFLELLDGFAPLFSSFLTRHGVTQRRGQSF